MSEVVGAVTTGNTLRVPAKIRVLLVEDSEADAYLFQKILDENFLLERAKRLDEAIADLEGRADAKQPDVIVLDLGLPDAHGTDGLSQLRDQFPSIPTIVLTGSLDEDIGEAAVRAGAEDFLTKDHLERRLVARAIRYSIERCNRRKQASSLRERLVHADRLVAIGQLAAGVAHELNNPAAFIALNLEITRASLATIRDAVHELAAQTSPEDTHPSRLEQLIVDTIEDCHELIEENVDGIDRIRNIVRDLTTFARVERDDVELVDINLLLHAACNLVRNELKHRARLVTNLAELPKIAGHKGKLCQVFTNLLVNAIHAIQEGSANGHQITLTTYHARECIHIEFSDTGCGIPPDIRTKIFEPFFTTKERDHGTGLGLSLCAEIVRKHRGEISFETERGKGTTFTIMIPVTTGLQIPEPVLIPVPKGDTDIKARVLIIDDEPMICRAFRRIVEAKHTVTTVSSGRDAIERLEDGEDFDVIICDLMMPELDGPMVFAEIQRVRPELSPRVVFCSGGAFTERTKAFTADLANPVLEKPVSRETLLGAVDAIAALSVQD